MNYKEEQQLVQMRQISDIQSLSYFIKDSPELRINNSNPS
jgi:replicative DNA helicase